MAKKREGLGTLTMTSGGCEVDVGGGRSPRSNNVLDFIFVYHSVPCHNPVTV